MVCARFHPAAGGCPRASRGGYERQLTQRAREDRYRMIEQIRRDIQALIDELLKEVDRLRRALAALTSRESESDRSGRAAPVAELDLRR